MRTASFLLSLIPVIPLLAQENAAGLDRNQQRLHEDARERQR
jgi:hypothetical protein